MFNCKRSNTDPLLNLMLTKHHLHVLQWPREGILPGELIIEKEGGQTVRAPLSAVFRDQLHDHVRERDTLSDIEERFSNKFDAKLGIKLLDHVATMFGGTSGRLQSAYDSAAMVTVRIGMAEWLDCNPSKLSDFIAEAALHQKQGVYSEGDRLYVITGVAVAKAIEVIAYDKTGAEMTAAADAAAAGTIEANLSAKRTGKAGVTYSGQKPIVFAIELFELELKGGRWGLKGVDRYVAARGEGDEEQDRLPPSEAAFIGDAEDGPAFINVTDAPLT
ncbi:hypothetical protein [Bradyrhizobium cajani]|uniref:Gasdermin bGSDM n=1 Tax=Bradyrhizobium cajani TaxID=1928661 RepID=A0A844T3U5_9BRAD|nr:hypothetical protein [Bradyrhizobium cajani]MCP3367747.1 hypothetical protein [Bradyrhizobium cajani]MVT73793.1 hypothetical protein [Bradyrhizobium cajani]